MCIIGNELAQKL